MGAPARIPGPPERAGVRHPILRPWGAAALGVAAGALIVGDGALALAGGPTGPGGLAVIVPGAPAAASAGTAVLLGAAVIVGSVLLLRAPPAAGPIGIALVVLSLLSELGYGGWTVGALVGLAAGLVALSWIPARGPLPDRRPGAESPPAAPTSVAGEESVTWNTAYEPAPRRP